MNSQTRPDPQSPEANRQPSKAAAKLHGVLKATTSQSDMWSGLGQGWSALGSIISGIVVWGGVGYLLDRVFGIAPVLMIVGVLVGNFAGVYLIYVRSLPKREERSIAA